MQLLETIKCRDGQLYNLDFHQVRFDMARFKYFPDSSKIRLENAIQVPNSCKTGLYRCRVVYSKNIEKVEFIPHQYRPVKSLKLIVNNAIDYTYKYSAREQLNRLFEQRGNCDDILIVKNGCISDSLTANSIFYDGEKWWTPDTPLLAGTQRALLLSKEAISVCKISPSNLNKYQKVGLINALQDMNTMPIIDIKNISY